MLMKFLITKTKKVCNVKANKEPFKVRKIYFFCMYQFELLYVLSLGFDYQSHGAWVSKR